MLAILAFEVTIYRHQEYYLWAWNNLLNPVSKTIFHNIYKTPADDDLLTVPSISSITSSKAYSEVSFC